MGFAGWPSVGRLPEVEPVEFGPEEVEVARVPGCLIRSDVSWIGGDLVLTNQRLLLTPVNVKGVLALTSMGLKVVQAASGPLPLVGQVMTVIGWAQKLVRSVSSDTPSIMKVTVGQQQPRLTKPPTLVVHRSNGPAIEFGVLTSRLTPNLSRKNVAARDQFLAQIVDTLGASSH